MVNKKISGKRDCGVLVEDWDIDKIDISSIGVHTECGKIVYWNEQKKRFVLLEYVELIVRNPEAKIIYREQERKIEINRHGEKLFKTSTIYFWTFLEKIEDCNVRVVVSQINNGGKHFFSVMGDNVVISKKSKKALK